MNGAYRASSSAEEVGMLGAHSWRACLEPQLTNHAGLLQPRRETTCLAAPGGELEPRNTRGSEPREQLPHLP